MLKILTTLFLSLFVTISSSASDASVAQSPKAGQAGSEFVCLERLQLSAFATQSLDTKTCAVHYQACGQSYGGLQCCGSYTCQCYIIDENNQCMYRCQ